MIEKIPIRENGLVGTLFKTGDESCAIILLGGSSGGFSEVRAEELAKEGFSTLALAYFAVDSLPPTLRKIPLEYFEQAIDLLRTQYRMERIGIWGGSRGGELSLILGSHFPHQIDAIAAHVPSSAVYGDFNDPGVESWSYRGAPIAPNAPFVYTQTTSGETESEAIQATPSFLKGMEDKKAFEASMIPVEKIRCPLLIISAEDDQMWPSSVFARQIIERLAEHRSPIQCFHIPYPRVGHAPSKGTSGLHPIMKRWFAYGGNPVDNVHAAADWIKQTVRFFKEML